MIDSLKMALSEMQGNLFVLSAQKGYESESFIKTFMMSDIAKDLDKPFSHTQWAGEHYLLSRFEDEYKQNIIAGECYSTEKLFWIGYLYRYWQIYNGDNSRMIYKQAPAKTMSIVYLMYHTMSPELAIDRLKESYRDKHPLI